MTTERLRRWLGGLPTHVVLIGLCVLWFVPTLGLLVTSVRPFQVVTESGWWTILAPPKGSR